MRDARRGTPAVACSTCACQTMSRCASTTAPATCAGWCCRATRGHDGWSEEQVARLVTIESLVGTAPAVDRGATTRAGAERRASMPASQPTHRFRLGDPVQVERVNPTGNPRTLTFAARAASSPCCMARLSIRLTTAASIRLCAACSSGARCVRRQ